MRNFVKRCVYSLPRVAGIYGLHRRRHRHQAIVLTYHGVVDHVPPDRPEYEYRNFVTTAQFERHVQFMLRHFRPLRVSDFADPGADIGGGFLITFDDGFRNNHTYAMPVLRRYGVEGCFFITTGLIGTRKLLWVEEVTRMLHHTRRSEVRVTLDQPRTFPLGTEAEREVAATTIRTFMKQMTPEPLQTAVGEMKAQLDDVSLEIDERDADRYLMMTWDEVRDMLANGQAIGSHTHTHPMLSMLPIERSAFELSHSKALIEKETGRPCETLSYPNGRPEDFAATQLDQLAELGYKVAFTQIPGFNDGTTHRYRLNRVNISLKMPLSLLEATVSGVLMRN